ncbi:MAG: T9SS type A sorting domain-containing protein [Bacteroidetes bacterium]|nr:T9SS type A sorting domain-containing protein [Bacteroidota bacterium]
MKLILLTICAFCFIGNAFSQVTVNLTPDKDNSIYSESTNSNGTGMLFSGYTCAGEARRTLIHFDIAGSIPSGATITAVTLTLNVNNAGGSSISEDYTLHPVTANWGEGTSFGSGTGAPAVFPDATWNDGILGTPWTTSGGDFSPAVATTTLTAALGNYNWSSAAMVINVQNWLNTPATNYGWILIGDETATCTARRFGSEESGIDPVLSITYSCATPPTASCQNAVAYLGSNGQTTLSATLVNNGSVANCGGPLAYSLSQSFFDCSDIVPTTGAPLILTAVFDGNLTGGLPKGVELFTVNDIPDLSIYGLGSANNGLGTDGEEFSFPAVSVSAGTYIYVASESTGFTSFFGFSPDYTTSAVNVNGDDAIELFENGSVIDVFGEITYVGAQPWGYSDGFAYRNNNTGPDGSTFVIGNWTLSGADALDPAVTNGTAPTPIPIGTYTTPAFIPVTLTVTDQFANVATCNASVVVFDTLGPNMACVAPATFNLDMTGNLTLGVVDIDAGTTDGCGLFSQMISQTSFNCTNLGLNQIILTGLDIYGNTAQCTADITIQSVGGLTITLDSVTDVTCNGDADGAIYTTLSGGSSPYVIDWDNDGTGDNDDSDDITGLTGGSYTLSVSDAAGCTAQLIADVIEPAVLDATPAVTNVSCVGDTDGSIDLAVTGGTPGYTFDWDNDGTGDTDDTEDLSGLAPGTYNVVITDANNCTNTFNAVVLNATPVDISVTQTGYTLTANATGATYQWVVCPANTPVPGAIAAVFNPVTDGDYAVLVTDGNGCEDTSACYTIFGLGTETYESLIFGVYPNPAGSTLTLTATKFNNPFTVTISDINGRVVRVQTIHSAVETFDISELENGIYFITCTADDVPVVTRFTVTH